MIKTLSPATGTEPVDQFAVLLHDWLPLVAMKKLSAKVLLAG
jgi:hypothetical protein